MQGPGDQLVGRTLGEFVLRERIGEGGFGAVYRAEQPALEREAVVKVLHERLLASRAASERFLREARLASKLDHPYAAHVYAFGVEPDGELWIAMELVRGTPLDQVLKLQGPLALERLVPLLDRICEVVHSAHENGIVHRDIKPANVMVMVRSGRLLPKLLDFGIAKAFAPGDTSLEIQGDEARAVRAALSKTPSAYMVDDATAATGSFASVGDTDDVELTQRGAIIGSPPYMAPEQWTDASRVDAHTDLYALGVLAYECLTGKPPYVAKTMTEYAVLHATADPAPLDAKFPSALDAVFARALAKEPRDRYPDALSFAAAFRQAAGVAEDAANLPRLDAVRRELAVASAPQPIADAVAALDAARNLHQAQSAIVQVGRTITRYVALVALACRSRVTTPDELPEVTDQLRALALRALGDHEWIRAVQAMTATWTSRRDAYPIPELVDACHAAQLLAELRAITALRERDVSDEDALRAVIEDALARLARVLDATRFLAEYPLVVASDRGIAELWMGTRRAQRAVKFVRGKQLAPGTVALLDVDGAPVLALDPLFQVVAPSPGAPLDLFLFDGRDSRGARLVALPAGFEHHDDHLWDWFRAQLSSTVEEESLDSDAHAPYRGLSAFSADDDKYFFGREKLVDGFVNRLKVQPLLAVVGRSGAGKSSFVHAGVVPALTGWRAIAMRPGAAPLAALAARLEHAGLPAITPAALASDRDALGAHLRADAAKHGPIVLVVDQLEELFTLCDDDNERRAFAEATAAAARGEDDPVRVIFTLRDDFLVRTEQLPALRNRIAQGLQLITVPGADDLARIVIEPARRVGYELEGDLAADMVREVADQPGALALLSFTAAKLWELRDRHFKRLTIAAYRTLGGVGGALARHADHTLDAMPTEERALAREAFRHLVTSENTRSVIARKELRELLGSSAHADSVIEKLVGARLLVASEDEAGGETIEIVHEALLVTWPRLAVWREQDAEGARFREQLRAAAKQWDERGRTRDLLWRGDALGDYTRWRARNAGPLTEIEAAFAAASTAAAARVRRNRRAAMAGAFAALVGVVVALAVLNTRIAGQRAAAEDAAAKLHATLETRYEDEGRRLVLANDPLQGIVYLAKAREYGAHGKSHDLLVAEAMQAASGQLLVVRHDQSMRTARFSDDGTRIVTAGYDGTARVWDAHTGQVALVLRHEGVVERASFAPGDAMIVTATDTTAIVWDARTGRELRRIPHASRTCAMFSPDGERVLAAAGDDATLAHATSDHDAVVVHGGGAGFTTCEMSRDGKRFALGDRQGTTRVWDSTTGALEHELRGHSDGVLALAFSPDGTRVIAASLDGTAIEWNVATGAQLHVFAHRDAVTSVAISPDGKHVLTGARDRTAAVWDTTTGARVATLEAHSAGISRVVFSPDGRYAVTAATDAGVALWDAASWQVVARWHGHTDGVRDVAFDRTGERVVTASDDGSARVWKVQPQARVQQLGVDVTAAHFSHDGRRVITGSAGGAVQVWDARTSEKVADLRGHAGMVTSAWFSPDDRAIATRGIDGTVRVWDATGARPPTIIHTPSAVDDTVEWSPDGASLVGVSTDGWIRCWDAATGQLRFEMQGHNGFRVYGATFDPSGKRLLSVGNDLYARAWDASGHPLAALRMQDVRFSVAFAPDGHRVISAVGKRATIWDVDTGASVRDLLGGLEFLADAQWSSDAAWAITASADGTARIWDATTGDLLVTFATGRPVGAASFAPAGDRVVIVATDGASPATIVDLPRAASDGELARVLRCRAPYRFDGDRLVAVTPAACDR